MKAIGIVRGLVGLTGLLQMILGVTFWTGHAMALVPLHMAIGSVFVLALAVQAVLSARAGAPVGLVVATLAWAVLLPAFGMAQMGILPGAAHWVVRATHLLMGVVAMALAARLQRAVAYGRAQPQASLVAHHSGREA